MGYTIADADTLAAVARRQDINDDGAIHALINADRTAYAARWQTLTSHWSDETQVPGGVANNRPAKAVAPGGGNANWNILFYGAVFTAPHPLPGSSRAFSSTGTTLATRGGLRCRARLREAEAVFRARPITIAGSYGQASTFGTAIYSLAQSATPGVWAWVTSTGTVHAVPFLLFPTGLQSGALYELAAFWRPINASTAGYCAGWVVDEPILSSVAP